MVISNIKLIQDHVHQIKNIIIKKLNQTITSQNNIKLKIILILI